MQALRLLGRQKGLRAPVWESVLAGRPQSFGRPNAGECVEEGNAVERRGFASAAEDEKSQKGYWRNLVKERLDQELESAPEAKPAAEGVAESVEASKPPDADTPLPDAPLPSRPPSAAEPAEPLESPVGPSTSEPVPELSKRPPKVFGDVPPRRPGMRPRPSGTPYESERASAWLERLLARQQDLTGPSSLEAEAKPESRDSLAPGVSGRSDQSEPPVVSRTEASEREQLDLAKGFADLEGIGAEKVRGLEPEVGLPPLEKSPPAGSSRGVVERSEKDSLAAAAEILGSVKIEEDVPPKREVLRPEAEKREASSERRPESVVAEKKAPSVSERALAAAEVFKQMQTEAAKAETAPPVSAQPDTVKTQSSVETNGAPIEPEGSTPTQAEESTPGEGVAVIEGIEPGEDFLVEEQLLAREDITAEAAALAHVPESVRDKLQAAADLQKIPVGWDLTQATVSEDELKVAYVYPEVLNAAEELEWASQALEELLQATTPPPLLLPDEEEPPESFEDAWNEEQMLSPYERERRRRAIAPTQTPAYPEADDNKPIIVPPRYFENVAQRAHPLNIGFLDNFIDERGNIIPRKTTGLRKKDQNKVERAIKTARQMGLLPVLSDLDWEHPTIMRLYPPNPEEGELEGDKNEELFEDEEEAGAEDIEEYIQDDEFADLYDEMEKQIVESMPDPDSEEYAIGRVLEKGEMEGIEYEVREVDPDFWVDDEGETEDVVGEAEDLEIESREVPLESKEETESGDSEEVEQGSVGKPVSNLDATAEAIDADRTSSESKETPEGR